MKYKGAEMDAWMYVQLSSPQIVRSFNIWPRTPEVLLPPVITVTVKSYLLNELPRGTFSLKFTNFAPQTPGLVGVTGSIPMGTTSAIVADSILKITELGINVL